MPQLNSPAPSSDVRKFFLPSTAALPKEEQAWVTMDVGPNVVADLEALTDSDTNRIVQNIRYLVNRIKEWNICEFQSSEIAPINLDTVSRLNGDDIAYLIKERVNSANQQPADLSEEKKSS